MKSPYDMSFLSKYGKVFKVFDDQDSGNICFGIEKGQNRYFVKFAGAPTAEYSGKTEDAVFRLKYTVEIYNNLRHPNLINYLFSEEIGEGFAVVFHWVNAECMGKQYPISREKFFMLPYTKRLIIFDDILSFLQNTVNNGYVAIDFYDGSILYDFEKEKTVICDIDFFKKSPIINDMGRMWGSSRFMSPEEFQLGSPIDEITNIFLAGAVAFALFGGETNHSITEWKIDEKFYHISLKAVNFYREERYLSIKHFIDAWNNAKQV